MSAPDTNPAAFPSTCLGDPEHPASVPGMSLRDWFAGQAMPLVWSLNHQGVMRANGVFSGSFPQAVARDAYEMADAMLAERAKGHAA